MNIQSVTECPRLNPPDAIGYITIGKCKAFSIIWYPNLAQDVGAIRVIKMRTRLSKSPLIRCGAAIWPPIRLEK